VTQRLLFNVTRFDGSQKTFAVRHDERPGAHVDAWRAVLRALDDDRVLGEVRSIALVTATTELELAEEVR
jgi:hypothetical protein